MATIADVITSDASTTTNGSSLDTVNTATTDVSIDNCILLNLSAIAAPVDSEGVVSTEVTNMFNAVRGSILFPLLLALGVPGNGVNLLVFHRHGLQERINLCLFVQALVDLALVIFVFFFYADYLRSDALSGAGFFRETGRFMAFIVGHHLIALYGFIWASMFCTAVIASERCFCVLWPLKSRTMLQTRTTGVMLATGTVVLVGGVWAIGEKYGLGCYYDVDAGRRMILMTDTPYFLNNRALVEFIDGVLYGLILPAIFIVIVTITTLITTLQLRASSKWRQESSLSSAALSPPEVALTKMLVAFCCQFVVLNLPDIGFRMSVFAIPEFSYTGRYSSAFVFMIGVTETLPVIMAATPCLLYYVTGTKYRRTVNGLVDSLLQRHPRTRTCAAPTMTSAMTSARKASRIAKEGH